MTTASSRARSALALIVVCVVLPSCPPPPRAVAAPTSSADPSAQSAFRAAEQTLHSGALAQAEAAFRLFVAQHERDVLAPRARLYLGRIALRRGRPSAARDHLTPLANGNTTLRDDARYYLGLAEVRMGKSAQARKLLAPLVTHVGAAREPALRAALSRAAERLGDRLAAVGHLDVLAAKSTRRSERVWARQGMQRIVGTELSEAQLRTLYNKSGTDSLLRALAAQRLIALTLARGDIVGATKLRGESAALRARFKVGVAERTSSRAGRAVGLLLPGRGRYRTAGKLVLRAAVSACGAFDSADAPITLVMRDSAKDAAAAARGLIAEGVVALVGTLSPRSARAVAAVARAAKVPFVSLSSAAASGALRVFPTARARAGRLAEAAKARGVKRVAVLAPRGGYGSRMLGAFSAAARAAGLSVVFTARYDRTQTAFSKEARVLAAQSFDALFVPDLARHLALLAPALAQAGLWSGRRAPSGKRAIQLLATADGANAALVARAGRYLGGALLVPGFYPDDNAAGSGALVRIYRQTHGRAPSLLEAFAYDAVGVLRSHVERGISTRAAMLSALRVHAARGLTGVIRFDGAGARVGQVALYQVKGGRISLVR